MKKKNTTTRRSSTFTEVSREIKLAEGVHVLVLYKKEMRKKASQTVSELRFMRGGLNPQLININDDDVKRITRSSGIIDINRPKDRRQQKDIQQIIQLVKSHHLEIQEGARNDGFFIAVLDDMYTKKGPVKLRPDIEALMGKDFLNEKIEEWFEEPDDPEPAFAPAPITRKRFVPAEMKVALLSAVTECFPDFNDQLMDALRDANLADAIDDSASGESEDDERDPETGFLPEKLD